ncbi:MAG: calcium-binding protein [Candidatus Brocadiaceae bacterium]|nr:calcium-binding protein [Candidatus Brocadiaceae bacterium]
MIGPGDQKEYERLKKTKPSYTDKYDMLSLADEVDGWMGILVNAKRVSDKKKFTLPLAELEATDERSKNYQWLDDYSVWFVNNK